MNWLLWIISRWMPTTTNPQAASTLTIGNADGVLVPNFQEETARQGRAIAGWQQWAEQEQERAEQERQRADRLANYLRSQGIDPDNL